MNDCDIDYYIYNPDSEPLSLGIPMVPALVTIAVVLFASALFIFAGYGIYALFF